MTKNTEMIIRLMNVLIKKVSENLFIAPAEWVEAAMRIESLTEDLDNEISIMKGKMAEKEAELIEGGEPATKAKALSIKAIDFEDYLKKEALRKRITSIIQLAKKRSEIK